MKKKAKLVLPKIAEFQKDDEDISKGEDDAKFPLYKRKVNSYDGYLTCTVCNMSNMYVHLVYMRA